MVRIEKLGYQTIDEFKIFHKLSIGFGLSQKERYELITTTDSELRCQDQKRGLWKIFLVRDSYHNRPLYLIKTWHLPIIKNPLYCEYPVKLGECKNVMCDDGHERYKFVGDPSKQHYVEIIKANSCSNS